MSGQPEPMPENWATVLGEKATAWRIRQGYSVDAAVVTCKLTEELGEFVRALVGEWEHREGRGDAVQEAAQTVIVLASLLFLTHPEVPLLRAVCNEMSRLDAWAVRS